MSNRKWKLALSAALVLGSTLSACYDDRPGRHRPPHDRPGRPGNDWDHDRPGRPDGRPDRPDWGGDRDRDRPRY